ncbi:MAG: tetratricopeptide repeat protein [Acidobacteriota bacterium]|nr:tetratricopeptide repeat protein [Acidobacteriota bacterium]
MRAFLSMIAAVVLNGVGAGVAGAATVQASATASSPEAPAAYYFLLGRHLEDERKVEEAIAAHKKAIALAPESAELRAELAALFARQDRVREALETAEAALQRDPANREANRIIGTVYAALNEQRQPFRPGDDPTLYSSKAIAALEKSRREAGFDINLELLLGRLYLGARDYEKAIGSLRKVVDDQPGYPDGAMLLAAAQDGAGLKDDEIRTLETALEYSPAFYRGHLRVAELYEQQRRFADAAGAYAHAAAANPRVDVSSRQAASLLNAGKAAEARDVLQTAMQKKTSPDAALLYMLGQAQRLLKDGDAAAATSQKLKVAFPDDARGLYLDAQLLRDRGRIPEAISAFQDLMKRSPEDASLVYEYASLLDRAGRVPDAERVLRDLLAKDPLDANALNSLGYLLADHGQRLDEAVDLVQRALKIEPANPSFLDSLGWAYFRQGRLDLADPPLTRAADQLPASSAVHEHLGDLRFKQERYADALAAFERSLAGDGDSIDRVKVERKVRDARERVKN